MTQSVSPYVLGFLLLVVAISGGGKAAASEVPARPESPASDTVYTQIGPIQRLDPTVAAQARPVRIEGVVTFGGPYFQGTGMFIQDQTGGIYVQTARTPFRFGDSVRVEGVTAPGAYAPTIEEPTFTKIGAGPLPEPNTDTSRILAGQLDSRWVRLTGTVAAASQPGTDPQYYVLEVAGQRIGAYVYDHIGTISPSLEPGARVQIEGVAATLFNEQRQGVGVIAVVPDPRFLTARVPTNRTRPAPSSLPIGQIGQFRPDRWQPGPVTITGSITHVGPGSSFFTSRIVVQDSSGAVWVETATTEQFAPGQHVRVTGRPQDGSYIPVLTYTRIRPTGTHRPIRPDSIGIADLESGQYGGQLVRMSGTVIDTARTPQTHLITLRSEGRLITARLSRSQTVRPIGSLQTGATVTVTGVLKPAPDWLYPLDLVNEVYAQRHALLMREPGDLILRAGPPWWTRDRLMGGLAATLLLGLGAVGWIYTLRRRVRTQTETIRQERDRAQEAARAKDAFLAQMSHEIRSPLSSVIGFADLLEADEDLADEHREHISIINESGRRLKHTLDSVLQLSALEAGSTQLRPEQVDVAAELQAQVQLFEPQAAEKGLDLQLDLSEETTLPAHLDPNGLQRILTNLISNAIKYTDEGRVTLGATEVGDSVQIWVEDTGTGMSEDELERVLEPFEQASRGFSREYEGTGLGLAIVHRLVEEMGGSLQISSEPEEGTRVDVSLPQEIAEREEPA